MLSRNRSIRLLPVVALAVAAAFTTGVIRLLSNSEAVMQGSVESALSRLPHQILPATANATDEFDPRSLHLSRLEDSGALDIIGPVAVGDHISISGRDGIRRVLQVVEMRELDIGTTKTSTEGFHSAGLVLVTSRVVGGRPDQIVRFIIASHATAPGIAQPAAGRTL